MWAVALSGANAQTLAECQQAAERNYPLIKRMDLITQTAALTVANIQKGWLPQLTVTAQATLQSDVTAFPEQMQTVYQQMGIDIKGLRKDQYRIGVDVQQTVFDGGAISSRKEVARREAGVEIARQEVDIYKVRQRVNELYFSLLLLDQQIALSRDLEQLLSSNEQKLGTMFKSGTAAESDYLSLKAERLKAAQQLASLLSQRQSAAAILSVFCGIEVKSPVKPSPTYDAAPAVRPELRLADSQVARAKATLGKAEHVRQARKVAQQCQVLLKNDGNLLPLKRNQRIAVIGPLGNSANDMLGCWSGSSEKVLPVSLIDGLKTAVGTQGCVEYATGSHLVKDPELEKILVGSFMGLAKAGNAKESTWRSNGELLREALVVASRSDVIIAALGENMNMNGEGASRATPNLPEPQLQLLEALVATGKPIVLVVFTGRPLELTWADQHVPAILNAWFPGVEAGNAIADVLFGDVNPSAKITVTFPRSIGQIPIHYNHKNTGRPHSADDAPYIRFKSNYIDVVNAPLYPFGYGLSYTTFTYDRMKLSSNTLSKDGKLTASIQVKNTGARAGKETVQLYIHDVISSSTRPVKELKGFKQIELQAGECQIVSFEITSEDLKFYNHELEYVCEPGEFEVMIGPNSRDVISASFVYN